MSAQAPTLHVILFQPEIPQNCGNIGRLCAFTGCRLHLIKPLGFSLDDRYLKRSGMDYWQHIDLRIHEDWHSFRASADAPQRIWLLTTHATTRCWDVQFATGDGLLFGNEGHGCPEWLHREIGDAQRITLPRFHPAPLRSLNLATSVGITTYEALRQIHLSTPA
jgi:tRNA (cytidine/uridine-2'-O-)-methyltransferase